MKFESVVWVDDIFSDSESIDLNEVVNGLERLIDIDKKEQLAKYASLSELDLTKPNQILKTDVKKIVERCANLDEFSDIISSSDDLSPLQAECLKRAFSKFGSLSTLSFEDIDINSIDSNVLCLLDIENTKSGGEFAGVDILQKILDENKTNFTVILFSHSAIEENEEEKRQEIFGQLTWKGDSNQGDKSSFSVMSKSRILQNDDESEIQNIVTSKLTSVFSRRTMLKIAERLRMEIVHKTEDVINALASEDIYSCENSVFKSSFKEGTSEIALLHRIFNLSQSDAVEAILRTDQKILENISVLRGLRNNFSESNNTSLNYFKTLRKKEFLIDAQLINKNHTPLIGGDTFNINEKKFILLSQACDTMLRPDGFRKKAVGYLVPFELKSDSSSNYTKLNKNYSKPHFLTLKQIASDHSYWVFKMNEFETVNLNLLDMVVYNQDGKCDVNFSDDCPSMIFLEGWKKRYEMLKQKIESEGMPRELKHFCLDFNFESDTELDMNPELLASNTFVCNNIQRAERFRSKFADYIFARFLRYRMRFALDHDFTVN